GFGVRELATKILCVPTPGHTRSHCVLLYDARFLFTGDHLDWDREENRLSASRNYCWHSWPQQIQSLARLLEYFFEWILPGHGQRAKLPAEKMDVELEALVSRLKNEEAA